MAIGHDAPAASPRGEAMGLSLWNAAREAAQRSRRRNEMTHFQKRIHRAREHLGAAGQVYPQAWADIEHMRTELRGKSAPDWPAWCFIPIAGAQAAVANDARVPVERLGLLYPDRLNDAARLAALAAWRMTQGIYRFDPTLYESVRTTPVSGDIPHDVLYLLPEWCIYIETPDADIHGAFVHLEHDANTGRPELRLVLDMNEALLPVALHLGPWSLAEAIRRAMDVAAGSALAHGQSAPPAALADRLRTHVEPLVSLLLYVCSQAGDIAGKNGQPGNPEPTRTRRDGWRLFPAQGVRMWDVGVRMGAALRAAYQAAETDQGGTHAGPRGHVRRAHWHGYWSGPMKNADGQDIPRERRKFDLRWQPPIAVNLPDIDALPATIRKVTAPPATP